MKRFIIGLTGAFGSGTSFIATEFFEKRGYIKCSLSSALKDEYKKANNLSEQDIIPRKKLQDFGDSKREQDVQYLAKIVDDNVVSQNPNVNIVIESIRNPAEIEYFREKYAEFILIGVFADYDVRWERVKKNYNNSKDSFDADEQRDKGDPIHTYGQQISACFFESDLIILNNEEILCNDDNDNYRHMNEKISAYLKALESPTEANPTMVEILMAAAYTSGRRSKCYKRRVGAIIVDGYDRIISSGFNGVPLGLTESRVNMVVVIEINNAKS